MDPDKPAQKRSCASSGFVDKSHSPVPPQSQGAQQALPPSTLTPRKGYPLSVRGNQNEPALHVLAAQLPVIELVQAPPTVNLDYGSLVCHSQQVCVCSREVFSGRRRQYHPKLLTFPTKREPSWNFFPTRKFWWVSLPRDSRESPVRDAEMSEPGGRPKPDTHTPPTAVGPRWALFWDETGSRCLAGSLGNQLDNFWGLLLPE